MPIRTITNQAKRFLLRDARGRRHERTAGALCQVFASFINHDGRVERQELEIVYDFVRSIFPESDHGILGNKLESAVARPQNIAPALKYLKRHLNAEHCLPFALQLFSLTRAGGDQRRISSRRDCLSSSE